MAWPTVLFISRMDKDFVIPTIKELLARESKINLVMICGGNDKLYKKLKKKFRKGKIILN